MINYNEQNLNNLFEKAKAEHRRCPESELRRGAAPSLRPRDEAARGTDRTVPRRGPGTLAGRRDRFVSDLRRSGDVARARRAPLCRSGAPRPGGPRGRVGHPGPGLTRVRSGA